MQFDKDTEEAFFVEDPNPDTKDDLDKLEHTTFKFISFCKYSNASSSYLDIRMPCHKIHIVIYPSH